MLWKMLQQLGYKGERKKRSHNFILTHDIDLLAHTMSSRMILGDIGYGILLTLMALLLKDGMNNLFRSL